MDISVFPAKGDYYYGSHSYFCSGQAKTNFVKWQPEYQAIHKGQLAVPSFSYYNYCYYYFVQY